jgi:hypothetical protein
MGEEYASRSNRSGDAWTDDAFPLLEALAERLRAAGWYARLVTADGWATSLRVVNPAAPPLNDDLAARQDEDGLWWFHWSFGERIAPVGELDIATARVTRVLGCPGRRP